MIKAVIIGAKTKNFLLFVFVLLFSYGVSAQAKSPAKTKPAVGDSAAAAANMPKVKQINDAQLKNLLKPSGRPLLVNFWATWCDPCREEFPDLVKIENDYRGKIDVITISLDFVEDINTTVPKFLAQMKAEMPTYLLVSEDESTIISSIKKDWGGGLPFTVLYGINGEISYFKEGKFQDDILRGEIEKTGSPKPAEK